jgi:hypothetical protein
LIECFEIDGMHGFLLRTDFDRCPSLSIQLEYRIRYGMLARFIQPTLRTSQWHLAVMEWWQARPASGWDKHNEDKPFLRTCGGRYWKTLSRSDTRKEDGRSTCLRSAGDCARPQDALLVDGPLYGVMQLFVPHELVGSPARMH